MHLTNIEMILFAAVLVLVCLVGYLAFRLGRKSWSQPVYGVLKEFSQAAGQTAEAQPGIETASSSGTSGAAPSAFHPRMLGTLALSAVLLAALAWLSPQQMGVTLYKVALLCLAAWLGYWLDRAVFPYSRPDSYLRGQWQAEKGFVADDANHPVASGYEWVFAAAMLRRAMFVSAAVIGVGLGL